MEKPDLLPKCIGFAVLKLFVDENGDQPANDQIDGSLFLNGGQFLLPIVYGRVPTEGHYSESLMDTLPHIHEAYLGVRLFDPSFDNLTTSRDNMFVSGGLEKGKRRYLSRNSIVVDIINSLPKASAKLRKFPVSSVIQEDVRRGINIDDGEKIVIFRQCTEWLSSVFPSIQSKIPLIDPRKMLSYNGQFGVYCALDMLYNMPIRNDLLESAKNNLEIKSNGIFSNSHEWDNHIKYYKSYFRYLPGRTSPLAQGEHLADMIIDDASLELDLNSREFNPVFNDNFSRTVGIELTQYACVLIVVTSVDILTSQKAAMLSTQQTNNDLNPKSPVRGVSRDIAQESIQEEKHFDETAFKLRGLLGIFFGNEDPNVNWWGLIPLLTESPYEMTPKENPPKIQSTTPVLRFSQSDISPESTTRGEHSFNKDFYFVNSGTHKVPLFQGFPPEEMLKSGNPMAWLLSNLSSELKNDPLAYTPSCSLFCGSKSSVKVATSNSNLKKKKNNINLCPGACAYVSIVDPRLRHFSNESITKDPNIIIQDDVLAKILKARYIRYDLASRVKKIDTRRRDKCLAEYKYIPNHSKARTYAQSIPVTIYSGTLLQEINKTFIEILTSSTS